MVMVEVMLMVEVMFMASVECSSSFHPISQGTDTCQGDSGGPLTVAENGEEILRISPTVRTYCTTLYQPTNVGNP